MGTYPQSEMAVVAAAPRTSLSGKALLALCAGLLLPGLGHAAAGRTLRAVGWFGACLAIVSITLIILLMPPLLAGLAIMLPLCGIVYLAHLVDAARCGRRSSKRMFGSPMVRLTVAVLLAVVAFLFYFTSLRLVEGLVVFGRTDTPSMMPTISPGDRYLCLKGYPVSRWSIVGVVNPREPLQIDYIKRIVGLPGERVEITGDALLIDGLPVAVPAAVGRYEPRDRRGRVMTGPDSSRAGNGCWGRPIVLGPDEYFVLGDHTADSDDSRFWPSIENHQAGAVPQSQLTVRALVTFWPPHRWQVFP